MEELAFEFLEERARPTGAALEGGDSTLGAAMAAAPRKPTSTSGSSSHARAARGAKACCRGTRNGAATHRGAGGDGRTGRQRERRFLAEMSCEMECSLTSLTARIHEMAGGLST